MKVRTRKSSIKHIKMCGFRKRMRSVGGRAILKRRRKIGRRPLLDV
ncbi:MAG: 50S ribosomal protein L34 [Planctomycetes bacterium]|nr:rpmH [Candidatus Brocadiaceae bacterium]MBI5306882.1 50S ribosomal protein L34 [Planctomycetota bacterium]